MKKKNELLSLSAIQQKWMVWKEQSLKIQTYILFKWLIFDSISQWYKQIARFFMETHIKSVKSKVNSEEFVKIVYTNKPKWYWLKVTI